MADVGEVIAPKEKNEKGQSLPENMTMAWQVLNKKREKYMKRRKVTLFCKIQKSEQSQVILIHPHDSGSVHDYN